eukprot:COSAG01_NODE_60817_length_292_cov_1.673575_1_plen_29_part_10
MRVTRVAHCVGAPRRPPRLHRLLKPPLPG